MAIQYTPALDLPYPEVSDAPLIASRDLRALAQKMDSAGSQIRGDASAALTASEVARLLAAQALTRAELIEDPVHIGPEAPTDGETLWVDTDEEPTPAPVGDVFSTDIVDSSEVGRNVLTAPLTADGRRALNIWDGTRAHLDEGTDTAERTWEAKDLAEFVAARAGAAAWDDLTGKPAEFPPEAHTHAQSDVTGLAEDLAGKADTVHTHTIDDVTGLSDALDNAGGGVIELGTEHLDTITAPGDYYQSFSSRATAEQGYPDVYAGPLTVTANNNGTQVQQTYTSFPTGTPQRFWRTYFADVWSPWWMVTDDTDPRLTDARTPLEHSHEIADVNGLQAALDGAGGGAGAQLLPEGTDLNLFREPGFWVVSTTAHAATIINWPTGRAGSLLVTKSPDAGQTEQTVTAHVSAGTPGEFYYRGTLSIGSTSWGAWTSPEFTKSTLTGTSSARLNIDTYRASGAWLISNRTYVDGLPGDGTGLLEVFSFLGTGMQMQRFTERELNDDVTVWHRFTLLSAGWAGIAWENTTPTLPEAVEGGSSRTSDVQLSDHGTRVEYARSRRGGGIGTSGQSVFMWRFDHWLVAFRDKILPILREFDLPGTLNVNYDNMGNEQNGGGTITWADVEAWNQYDGVEIANHGSTHTNAATMDTIYHEVVDGRRNLEAAMPRVAVETWQEHGSAYLIAGDLEGDTGLDLGRSLEAFTESYAGRLVMAEHAVVEGKAGSFYPPLTGTPQIGQSHYSLDRDTTASTIETIQYAQAVGRGLTGYTHPGLMDMVNIDGSLFEATYNGDGSVDFEGTHYATEAEFRTVQETAGNIVHMPTKDFRAVCEWLATERDAGRLMVMTAAGGGFAEKRSDHRENLFIRDSWAGAGWTSTGTGDSYTATSTSGAGPMFQTMLLFTRFGWAMGAAHEVVVYAKADAETTLTLSMEQLGDPSNWNTERVHTVPGDGVLRPYRLNLTLPRDRSISQMTVRVGGPSLTIEGEPMLAAI